MRALLVFGVVIGIVSQDAYAQQTAVVVAGNAPQRERDTSLAATTDWIKAQPGAVVAAALPSRDAARVAKCVKTDAGSDSPWKCIKSAVPKSADRVLVGFVDSDTSRGGHTAFRIVGYLVSSSLDFAIVERRLCDPCSDSVLRDLASELAQSLFRKLATVRDRTTITINTFPPRARVMLDGEAVAGPVISTYPGKHKVTLELDGYHTVTRDVEVSEEKNIEIKETLRRKDPDPVRQDPKIIEPAPSGTRWGPLVLGAGGLVVAAGGVVMIAYGNDLSSSQAEEQKEFYYNYRPPGVILTISGGLMLGGAFVWWRYGGGSRRSVVTAQPLSGGAALQWSTRF